MIFEVMEFFFAVFYGVTSIAFGCISCYHD
jgi:hypothetical protein